MKLPRWESRDEADQTRMEHWVNEQLDLLLEREFSKPTASRNAMLRFFRGRSIDRAIQRHDHAALMRLTEATDGRLQFISKVLARPKRGRKPKPRGHVASASEHVDWVRAIWKKYYRRRNRVGNAPSAEDIVLRRFRALGMPVNRKALISFRKHHRTSSR